MTGFGSHYVYTVNASSDFSINGTLPFDGDISCETGDNNAKKFKYIFHCVNKTDLVTFLSWYSPLTVCLVRGCCL